MSDEVEINVRLDQEIIDSLNKMTKKELINKIGSSNVLQLDMDVDINASRYNQLRRKTKLNRFPILGA